MTGGGSPEQPAQKVQASLQTLRKWVGVGVWPTAAVGVFAVLGFGPGILAVVGMGVALGKAAFPYVVTANGSLPLLWAIVRASARSSFLESQARGAALRGDANLSAELKA